MGREVSCECRWPAGHAKVKALLESGEVILRGGFKRRIPLATINTIEIVGDELRLQAGAEQIALLLGAREATHWAAKLRAPPPTLRAKLGLAGNAKTLVFGDTSSQELQEALASATTTLHERATMTLAVVHDELQITQALDLHRHLQPASPIWIVHGKGKAARMGEALVRTHMRAAGYMDNKVVAVSETLTAARFALAHR